MNFSVFSRITTVTTIFATVLGFISTASAQNVKIRVELIDVYCDNTEDVTGPDEFYLVASLKGGTANKPSITKPFDINDKKSKNFPADQSVLFEGDVPKGGNIVGGMVAFDEDYGKD